MNVVGKFTNEKDKNIKIQTWLLIQPQCNHSVDKTIQTGGYLQHCFLKLSSFYNGQCPLDMSIFFYSTSFLNSVTQDTWRKKKKTGKGLSASPKILGHFIKYSKVLVMHTECSEPSKLHSLPLQRFITPSITAQGENLFAINANWQTDIFPFSPIKMESDKVW